MFWYPVIIVEDTNHKAENLVCVWIISETWEVYAYEKFTKQIWRVLQYVTCDTILF
jgi:hypothetical protein